MGLIHIILTGFLARAAGWGADSPRWKPVANLFDAWSCAALFALLSAFYVPLLVAPACGVAFLVWRLPGFNKWESWPNMFWRGLGTSVIGFTLVSLVAHGNLYGWVLSIPFAAVYMLIYAGGYKWLPQTILGFDRHVWIEHASGWVFGATILWASL